MSSGLTQRKGSKVPATTEKTPLLDKEDKPKPAVAKSASYFNLDPVQEKNLVRAYTHE